MNRKIISLLPLSLALAGCMSTNVLSTLSCGAYTGPVPPCEGDPNNPQVTLNTNTLDVTPRCVNAKKTKTVTIHVVPPAKNDVGTVAILPKNISDTWLTGTNSPDKTKIEIPVPDWVSVGEHSYGIVKSTGDCRDPRIHVEN